MASTEKTHEVIALLRQGISSSEIAKRLDVSPPVVWGIKAYWRMGWYGQSVREDRTITKGASSEHVAIIGPLVEGIDPFTGEILSEGHLLKNQQVVSALSHAVQVLNQETKRANRQLPPNAGNSWTQEEEETLIEKFDNGIPIREIAAKHGRSKGGITSRLVRLGKIERKQTPAANEVKYVNIGSISQTVGDSNLEETPETSPTKSRHGTWSMKEKMRVANAWSSQNSSRDAMMIRNISEETGRSPLAIIIRLYQERNISIAEGDALCRELDTKILLSETNVVGRDV